MRTTRTLIASAALILFAVSCADEGGSKKCGDDEVDEIMTAYYACAEEGDCPFDEECLQACFDDMCADLDDLGCPLDGTGCEDVIE